jgi:hypothetical protein
VKVVQLVPQDPERCALYGMSHCDGAPTHKVTWQTRHGSRRVVAFVCTTHALRAAKSECRVERLAP